FLFFFQAEDGIRDFHVTGVQTCALPISRRGAARPLRLPPAKRRPDDPIPRPAAPDPASRPLAAAAAPCASATARPCRGARADAEIGRASCREGGEIAVVAGALAERQRNV